MWRVLLLLQGAAAVVLLWRLLPGVRRVPAIMPAGPRADTTVSVIVPTLNEAARVGRCLDGLARQAAPLTEIIVVDSRSTDGTGDIVASAMTRDSRIRLTTDPPLPPGWIGKVWALQHGLSLARGEWILGVDADIEPTEGMVAGAVTAAMDHGLELVSFAPRFAGQTAGERFLQPALLATLVYRTGAPGAAPSPGRMLANGQCFLVRRDVLAGHDGYAPARASFADDVYLARYLARAGVRCGFLDGRRLFRVRSYSSAGEMWREWGRSVDLADASGGRQAWDLLFLMLVQALPLPLLAATAAGLLGAVPAAVVQLNAALLTIRVALLGALGPSYERRGIPFYGSWLADLPAVFRVTLSTFRRPERWRGRTYRDLV